MEMKIERIEGSEDIDGGAQLAQRRQPSNTRGSHHHLQPTTLTYPFRFPSFLFSLKTPKFNQTILKTLTLVSQFLFFSRKSFHLSEMQGLSATGSVTDMSIVSKDDTLAMSSEDSCSPDDESELELSLGLSLRGNKAPIGSYARILTAKDFMYVGGGPTKADKSSSTSSSSSALSSVNVAAGTKRAADSVANQPVGWPPIRTYRMNSLVNQAKSATEVVNSEKGECKTVSGKVKTGGQEINGNAKARPSITSSQFVKVNMDGSPIGRKINLTAHSSYEALARTLEEMFQGSSTNGKLIRSGGQGYDMMVGETTPSKLLDGSFDFALTYEDKEGDWMLVGDVPWEMFLTSVKRLRIMRTTEANGLGMLMSPRLEERNARQRCTS